VKQTKITEGRRGGEKVKNYCARLKYSSSSTTVALENGHVPTTWQEPELMFRNNGLLHHSIVSAAGLLSFMLANSAMLANSFSTSTCFAIFELI